jgi:hypothetical protein
MTDPNVSLAPWRSDMPAPVRCASSPEEWIHHAAFAFQGRGRALYVLVGDVTGRGVRYDAAVRRSISLLVFIAGCGGAAAPGPSLPGAVVGSTAVAGDGRVLLDWSAVSSATGYRIYWSESPPPGPATIEVAAPPFTHEGLVNGTTYYYEVRAVNAAGEGSPSPVVSAAPAAARPEAPVISAVAGDGEAYVSWTDVTGAEGPGGKVTGYDLYWSSAPDPVVTGTAVPSVRSPFHLTGLDNGTTYWLALVAVTDGAVSEPSAAVELTPAATVPDVPVGFVARAGVRSVTLEWDDRVGLAPAVGHAAVTGYALYWTAGADTTGTLVPDARSPFTHTGLTAAVEYRYVLRAIGAHGVSGATAEVAATPGFEPPAAPTGLTAASGDGQVTLTWTSLVGAPVAAGEAPVTSYNVYWSTVSGAGSGGTRVMSVGTGWIHASRSNGTSYFYVITAVSAGGESLPSDQVVGVPAATFPSAPTGVRAAAASGGVTLTWDDLTGLAVPGQPTVVSYDAYRSTTAGAGTTGTLLPEHNSGLVDSGLTNGTTYYYVVVANAAAGPSPPSVEVSAVAGVTYPLGGVVSGLLGSGLVVADTGGARATVSTDGPFTLDAGVAPGATYAVTVEVAATNPTQKCLVLRGQGTMPAAAVADLEVVCSLQVATFNLEFFAATSTAAKQQGVADIIDANGFDAVAVEEVADGALGPFISTYLAPSDPASWGFELGNTGGAQQVGVLYRKGVLSVVESFELKKATSASMIDETASQWSGMRLPLRVTLRVAGGVQTVTLLALHLKANTCASGDAACCNKRRLQANDLALYLAAHATEPIVTLGDYNEVLDQNGSSSAGQTLGICTSYGYDSLAAMEGLAGFEFLTRQPADMLGLTTYYTYVTSPHSTIDQLLVAPSLLPLVVPLDGSGHKAEVIMHKNAAISDHMPPYFYLAVE